MPNNKMLNLISLAKDLKELEQNPLMQKFLAQVDRLIEKQTGLLCRQLSKNLEDDARLSQIIRAEIRGMKTVRSLIPNIIKQGQIALEKLNKR